MGRRRASEWREVLPVDCPVPGGSATRRLTAVIEAPGTRRAVIGDCMPADREVGA